MPFPSEFICCRKIRNHLRRLLFHSPPAGSSQQLKNPVLKPPAQLRPGTCSTDPIPPTLFPPPDLLRQEPPHNQRPQQRPRPSGFYSSAATPRQRRAHAFAIMTSSPLPNLQRAPEPLEQHHVQLRTSRQIAQRSPEINMRSVQQHGVDPPTGAAPRQLDQQHVRSVVEHGGHGVLAGGIGHERGCPRGRHGGADKVEGGEHAVEGGGGRAEAGTAGADGGGERAEGARDVAGEGGQGGSEGRGELVCGADVEFAPDDGAAVDALEGVNAAFETDELVYGGEVGEGSISVAEDDLMLSMTNSL